MKIVKNTLNDIFKRVPMFPPETGGIIGMKKDVIRYVEFDKGMNTRQVCTYEPDVDYLNAVIEKWQQNDIAFCGLFHTHFYGVRTLSDGDKMYINSILNAMPETINKLYFPIVLPEKKELIAYMAIRKGNEIQIVEEVVEVI